MIQITAICDEAISQKLCRKECSGWQVRCLPMLHQREPLPVTIDEDSVLVIQTMVSASMIQDLLGEISAAHSCPILLLEMESTSQANCVFSANFPSEVLAFLKEVLDMDLFCLHYPFENWTEKFPSFFMPPEIRETKKAILYGMRFPEFEASRERYNLQLGDCGYYLFVWELAKSAFSHYSIYRDLHYFLHAHRLKEFQAVLERHTGGEILFSDISFAYILINAPNSKSDATCSRFLQHFVANLAEISGNRDAFCFLSDYIPNAEHIPGAYASFQKACACRFFCRETAVLSPGYIHTHRRWIDSALIAETLEQAKHLIHVELSGPMLPECIRKLYLDMIKPSMSYMLYYIITEMLLICLEQEQPAKLVLDAFNDPYALLQAPYSSVEESCQKILDCISLLNQQTSKRYSIHSPLVQQAMTYIDAHITSDFQVGELARHISVNAAYLGQLFKAEVGSTMKDYITKQRISLAKERLLRSNDSIAAIATGLGYGDFRHFSRLFKKYVGISPSKYRRSRYGDFPFGETTAHFSPEI